jgi:quercetin dioxygenase-like cupin family protein
MLQGRSRVRVAYLVPAAVLAACASSGTATAEQAATAAPPPKVVTTPLVRTGRTISNQPLKLPQGEAEVAAAALDIPAGGATPIHQHPWSRFVYVEKGPVRIVNHDTGESRDFPSGTLLPEVVAQWHEGRALGSPVRLIVIDLVPPGVNNTVMKPAHSM